MRYFVRHITRYRYSAPVQENVMELRMKPRSDGRQHCLEFEVDVDPSARVFEFTDYLGNHIHYFDIALRHVELVIKSQALVDVESPAEMPASLPYSTWHQLDQLPINKQFWDMTRPSRYTTPTPLLNDLAAQLDWRRHSDPLTLLRQLNQAMFNAFDYVPHSTNVDSPIDVALKARSGVCQDFTHIMLALSRQVGIPARYVSGYLFHRHDPNERSDDDATHAWLEAWLPDLGWVGFDPTNNLVATNRHIRVAIGRDYADIPPTQGVFRGSASTKLAVGVWVGLADAPRQPDLVTLPDKAWQPPSLKPDKPHQQQQQQQ